MWTLKKESRFEAARRLQMQERRTQQIAQAVQEHLNPVGVGVVIKARNLCMGCRGVLQPEAEMITSCMVGALREQPETRAELLSLILLTWKDKNGIVRIVRIVCIGNGRPPLFMRTIANHKRQCA